MALSFGLQSDDDSLFWLSVNDPTAVERTSSRRWLLRLDESHALIRKDLVSVAPASRFHLESGVAEARIANREIDTVSMVGIKSDLTGGICCRLSLQRARKAPEAVALRAGEVSRSHTWKWVPIWIEYLNGQGVSARVRGEAKSNIERSDEYRPNHKTLRPGAYPNETDEPSQRDYDEQQKEPCDVIGAWSEHHSSEGA